MLATYSNRFGLFFTNWKLLEWQNYAGLLIKNTGLEVFKLRKQQWVKFSKHTIHLNQIEKLVLRGGLRIPSVTIQIVCQRKTGRSTKQT